jgi:hypothetical protein
MTELNTENLKQYIYSYYENIRLQPENLNYTSDFFEKMKYYLVQQEVAPTTFYNNCLCFSILLQDHNNYLPSEYVEHVDKFCSHLLVEIQETVDKDPKKAFEIIKTFDQGRKNNDSFYNKYDDEHKTLYLVGYFLENLQGQLASINTKSFIVDNMFHQLFDNYLHTLFVSDDTKSLHKTPIKKIKF